MDFEALIPLWFRAGADGLTSELIVTVSTGLEAHEVVWFLISIGSSCALAGLKSSSRPVKPSIQNVIMSFCIHTKPPRLTVRVRPPCYRKRLKALSDVYGYSVGIDKDILRMQLRNLGRQGF